MKHRLLKLGGGEEPSQKTNPHTGEPKHSNGKNSPHSRCVAYQSKLSLWLVARQELVEVPVLHVFGDHTERVAADAHS